MSFLDRFQYQIYGDDASRPKLVFLHGLMGSGANWRRIVPHFAGRFQVLTYDQRGHGRSFQPPTGYDSTDYASDLLHIVNELHWERVHVVGHSMGGRNALTFAHQHPERVLTLVIEDIAPAQRSSEKTSQSERLLEGVPVPFSDLRTAKQFFLGEFVERFADVPQIHQIGQFLYGNIVPDEKGQGVWRFYLPGILQSVRVARQQERWFELEQLNCPLLVVRGQNSADLSRPDFERMRAASARVAAVEIPGAGHWVHFDQPLAFSRELDGFLAGWNSR